jgi:hypothetical protein
MAAKPKSIRAGSGIIVIRTVLGNSPVETSGITVPAASTEADVVTKGYVDSLVVSITNPGAIFSGNIGETDMALPFTKVYNKFVVMLIPGLSASQTGSHTCHAAAGSIPSDYRPSASSCVAGFTMASDNGVTKMASITVSSDGSISIADVSGSNWSGTGTFTVSACAVLYGYTAS